jgi:hypothetical protein
VAAVLGQFGYDKVVVVVVMNVYKVRVTIADQKLLEVAYFCVNEHCTAHGCASVAS